MKKYYKYCCASVVALILSIICALLSMHALPDFYQVEEPTETTSVMDQVELEAFDCEIDPSGTITMTGDDPNLYLRGLDNGIQTLCFVFTEPVNTDVYTQLYYSRDGQNFSEADSVSTILHSGQDKVIFALDTEEYELLRVDINCDFTLLDIRTSEQLPVVVKQAVTNGFNWVQWLLSLIIFLGEALLIVWKWGCIRAYFVGRYHQYCQQRKAFWRRIAIFFGFVVLAVAGWGLLCLLGILVPNGYTVLYFLLGGCTLGGLFALWKQHAAHPERIFLIVAICVGLVYATLLPKATIVSLDDETHYERALQMSYCGTTYYTDADYMLINQRMPNRLDARTDGANAAQLNALYEQGAYQCVSGVDGWVYSPAYLASGGAMWLVRILGGSFTQSFIAGRIGNLLCYALVFYFAIKRMKRGGVLTAAFALIPMMIFSASNYSYDGFCLSLLAMGTAFFLDEYWHRERPLSWPNVIGMLVCLTLGCLPKAIYFPIFLICLFMPKEKFANKRQRKCYVVLVVAVTVMVAFTFLLPLLFSQGGASRFNDTRGGADINAGEQLSYIFSDPLRYAVMLLKFLFTGYFAPSFWITYAISYQAYMPAIPTGVIFVVVILLLLLFERSDAVDSSCLHTPSPALKVASAVAFFCAVCLSATAMYVVFTPVGAAWINGCQARYMMPVLLPMLMIVRLNLRRTLLPCKYQNFAVFFLVGGLLFAGQLPLVASYSGLL